MTLEFLTPTFILSVLIALAVHEWAHAASAYRLGDPTAKYDGRLTLNPISHLDPIGTVLFVIVGFGWGKPVPVDPRFFKHPKRDNALVALAGPMSNLVLAFIALGLMFITKSYLGGDGALQQVWGQFLNDFLLINMVLMAFNLLPIPPLDGSKILHVFIPDAWEFQYRVYLHEGWKILLALVILSQVFNFPFFSWWIHLVIDPLMIVMLGLISVF